MHYCNCKGTTKIQLLQRVFQRMLTTFEVILERPKDDVPVILRVTHSRPARPMVPPVCAKGPRRVQQRRSSGAIRLCTGYERLPFNLLRIRKTPYGHTQNKNKPHGIRIIRVVKKRVGNFNY